MSKHFTPPTVTDGGSRYHSEVTILYTFRELLTVRHSRSIITVVVLGFTSFRVRPDSSFIFSGHVLKKCRLTTTRDVKLYESHPFYRKIGSKLRY